MQIENRGRFSGSGSEKVAKCVRIEYSDRQNFSQQIGMPASAREDVFINCELYDVQPPSGWRRRHVFVVNMGFNFQLSHFESVFVGLGARARDVGGRAGIAKFSENTRAGPRIERSGSVSLSWTSTPAGVEGRSIKTEIKFEIILYGDKLLRYSANTLNIRV